MRYNGHKDWQHWNVSLWINNDDLLYRAALHYVRTRRERQSPRNHHAAAAAMLHDMLAVGTTTTPDGADYTVETIEAAMEGMNE